MSPPEPPPEADPEPDASSTSGDSLLGRVVVAANEGREALAHTLADVPGEALPDLISALARRADQAAAVALEAIDSVPHAVRDVRKSARRALHQLRTRGVRVAPQHLVAAIGPLIGPSAPTVVEARVTASDFSGSRALWLFLDRPGGGGVLLGLVLNDQTGIRDAMVRTSTRRRYQLFVEDTRREDPQSDWVSLPPEYARQLVEEAIGLNHEQGTPLPREFLPFREYAASPEHPFERALVYQEISSGEIRLQPQLAEEASELFDLHPVEHWLFEPEQIMPYLEELEGARTSLVVLPGDSPEERQRRAVERAVNDLFTPQFRRGLRRRLEEMAYIFQHSERPRDARLALAAAMGLEQGSAVVSPLLVGVVPTTGGSLASQPYVRRMIDMSFELAVAFRDLPPPPLQEGEAGSDSPV